MKLIVFDLDFTLWNAGGTWCDHTFPPYKRVNGYIEDSVGSIIFLYPDARNILERLHGQGYQIAAASRTHEPSWALELLKLFEINHFFTHKEIYPGSKIEHFRQLQHLTGIDYEKMTFFDDEMRNIDDVSALGVNAVLVDKGINWELIERVVDLS
jgi:magnesium-dependent phosphatase 1